MKEGFPRGVNFTPVPDPLLASLLEEIDSLDELKVILRTIHELHRQRKVPASISFADLYSDRTVAAMLHTSGRQLEELVQSAVNSASNHGILMVIETDDSQSQIFLNTEPVRRALVSSGMDIATKRLRISRDLAKHRRSLRQVGCGNVLRTERGAYDSANRRKHSNSNGGTPRRRSTFGNTQGGGSKRKKLELYSCNPSPLGDRRQT